jgi:hypothetical protein
MFVLNQFGIEQIEKHNASGYLEPLPCLQAEGGEWFARDAKFNRKGEFVGITFQQVDPETAQLINQSLAAKQEAIKSGELEPLVTEI